MDSTGWESIPRGQKIMADSIFDAPEPWNNIFEGLRKIFGVEKITKKSVKKYVFLPFLLF